MNPLENFGIHYRVARGGVGRGEGGGGGGGSEAKLFGRNKRRTTMNTTCVIQTCVSLS